MQSRRFQVILADATEFGLYEDFRGFQVVDRLFLQANGVRPLTSAWALSLQDCEIDKSDPDHAS